MCNLATYEHTLATGEAWWNCDEGNNYCQYVCDFIRGNNYCILLNSSSKLHLLIRQHKCRDGCTWTVIHNDRLANALWILMELWGNDEWNLNLVIMHSEFIWTASWASPCEIIHHVFPRLIDRNNNGRSSDGGGGVPCQWWSYSWGEENGAIVWFDM